MHTEIKFAFIDFSIICVDKWPSKGGDCVLGVKKPVPINIITNKSFQLLMKMGWPKYYIPSAETVARVVQQVFACMYQYIVEMLHIMQRRPCNGTNGITNVL